MRKALIIILALLMGSSLLLASVKAPLTWAQQEVKLKPVEVEVVMIETLFAGESNMALVTTFRVKNPNSIEVTLDSLEYTLFLRDILMGGAAIRNVYIPPESEVEVSHATTIGLIDVVAPFLMLPGMTLVDGLVGGASVWKEIGGTSAGLLALFQGMLPGMIPEVLVTACAKFGIPEAIAHSLAMVVVMPLLAGLLPKLVDRIVDEVWALGAEPPPTYKVEGMILMIAGGETIPFNFSQTCVGDVTPPPPPLLL